MISVTRPIVFCDVRPGNFSPNKLRLRYPVCHPHRLRTSRRPCRSTIWNEVTSKFLDAFPSTASHLGLNRLWSHHRPKTSEHAVVPIQHQACTPAGPSRGPLPGATSVGWNPTSFQVVHGDTPSNMVRPRISRSTLRHMHTALSAAKTFCAEYCWHSPSVSASPCANSTDGSLFLTGRIVKLTQLSIICSMMSHSGGLLRSTEILGSPMVSSRRLQDCSPNRVRGFDSHELQVSQSPWRPFVRLTSALRDSSSH